MRKLCLSGKISTPANQVKLPYFSQRKAFTLSCYHCRGGFRTLSNIYDEIFCERKSIIPVGIYLLQVNSRNTGTRCEICSKLTIKTPERRQYAIIVFCLVSLLLTLNIFHTFVCVSIVLLLTLNMQMSNE